jgi:hypothetical protein
VPGGEERRPGGGRELNPRPTDYESMVCPFEIFLFVARLRENASAIEMFNNIERRDQVPGDATKCVRPCSC